MLTSIFNHRVMISRIFFKGILFIYLFIYLYAFLAPQAECHLVTLKKKRRTLPSAAGSHNSPQCSELLASIMTAFKSNLLHTSQSTRTKIGTSDFTVSPFICGNQKKGDTHTGTRARTRGNKQPIHTDDLLMTW